MRIKLDENLPLELQGSLTGLGHDLHSVFDENLGGEPDEKIWQACSSEERFLITHAGIMILRVADDSRANLIRVVLQAFQEQDTSVFERALVVVTDVKIRIRRP